MAVAVVTGGATGLGRAVARHLLHSEFDVAVTFRTSMVAARAFVAEAQGMGRKGLSLHCDDAKMGEVMAAHQAVLEQLGAPAVLVLATGPFVFERHVAADVSPKEWQAMLQGNLTSAFAWIHHVVPAMRQAHFGRIVTFGYDRAQEAPAWPGRGSYAAAKTGLASLTRTLAAEEAKHGITVNMICPGSILPAHKEQEIEDVRQLQDDRIPVGRPGSGGDVARVVDFLIDKDADFITGNIVSVGGGLDVLQSAWR